MHTLQRVPCGRRSPGTPIEAEQLATEALQIGTDSGQPDAAIFFGAQLVDVSFQRGTMGELVPLIEQMVADNPGLPDVSPRRSPWPTPKRAAPTTRVACWRSSRPPTSIFRWTQSGSTGMVGYAEAAIECRDPKYAGAAVRPARAVGRSVAATAAARAEGPVSHYLGGLATVLGRYDEADAYFAQAAAFNDRAGAKFFAARTNLSWGKMLAERNAPGRRRKGPGPAHQGARRRRGPRVRERRTTRRRSTPTPRLTVRHRSPLTVPATLSPSSTRQPPR